MPKPCAPRANTWSSDGRSAADQSAWRPSTILHEDVVVGDRGEQRRGVGRHRRAARLAAVDRGDERERLGARVERDVDGEERAGGEADHPDRVGPHAEPRGVLPDESIARRPSSAAPPRLQVLLGRDQVADRPRQLRRGRGAARTPSNAAIRASNAAWSASDACTRYLRRNAV